MDGVSSVSMAPGRRAALFTLAALPLRKVVAEDDIAEIAARNAKAAEAERASAAAKAAVEPEGDNRLASVGLVGGILAVGTVASLVPVTENVKRVGKKIQTGKNQR